MLTEMRRRFLMLTTGGSTTHAHPVIDRRAACQRRNDHTATLLRLDQPLSGTVAPSGAVSQRSTLSELAVKRRRARTCPSLSVTLAASNCAR